MIYLQAGKHLDDEDNNDDDDDEDIELDFYETPLDNEEIDEYANFKATLLGTSHVCIVQCNTLMY